MATDSRPESPDPNDQLRPGWLPLLNDLARRRGKIEEDFQSVIGTLFRDYLLSDDDDDDAPATFAQRFDDLYGEVYEPKFNGYNGKKRGWTGYLLVFYRMVFSLAVAMDYDDPKQIKIIQLLSELRKLPTHAVKIFVQPEFGWIDSEIWTRDPLVSWALHGVDPGSMTVKDAENLNSQEKIDEYEAHAAAFISYHTFSARCTAAGFDIADKTRFNGQESFISWQLEPGEELLDSQIMAVAQWILIAGDVTHAECVKKQRPPPAHRIDRGGWDNGNGPVVWKKWGNRLSELAAGLEKGGDPGFKLFEKNREVLTDVVVKARDKVIGLDPALFTKSEQEPGQELLTESTKHEPGTEPLTNSTSTKQDPGMEPVTDSTKQQPATEPLTDSTKQALGTEPLTNSTKQEPATEPLTDSTKPGRIQRGWGLIQQSWGRIQRSLSPKRRA